MNRTTRIALITLAVAASGCTTVQTPNARDPLEGFNRTMFTFNDKVDQVALKPAAQAYRAVVPPVVQRGVGNFFGNLADVWTGVNNVLQGKVGDGFSDFMRFAVNSTFGLAGVIDIGSAAGMPKHKEDFGQTLGRWGLAPGPYLVLPLLGPSTIRDTAALPLDFRGDLWSYADPVNVRNIGTGVRLLDGRASILDASDLIEGAALDRYEFVRDAYFQRRESRINDGESRTSDEDSTAPGRNRDRNKTGASADKDDYPRVGPTPEPVVPGKPAVAPVSPVAPAAPVTSPTPATPGVPAAPAAAPQPKSSMLQTSPGSGEVVASELFAESAVAGNGEPDDQTVVVNERLIVSVFLQ